MKIYKPKKSLGQNFLKSEQALREIIKAGEIKKDDVILEIGPGKGVLTARLLENSGRVIAVEKDRDLIGFLQEKFKHEIKEKRLTLANEDILEFETKENKYKIIANIPYNITGAILKKFLTEENQPELMVLMVQNEVAKRIVARDNKESILSISVKAYGEPKMIMKVPSRYFSPAPKVDSAIIKIGGISKKLFSTNTGRSGTLTLDEEKFWSVIHAGFAHKRKILLGNLKGFDKNVKWGEILSNIRKTDFKNVRAEDLSLNDWISLVNEG
ncbi:MAG: 16S rRNA (adenine(1518)-N(6)/adenine(1519)-N(6))-dimethyltransferase RsmA [bacterium]|nr:16S rRNA (adenine(1518)-N(6)/adenine(1519)-N(6))-dimethyltransferase RsmA [bacterium]